MRPVASPCPNYLASLSYVSCPSCPNLKKETLPNFESIEPSMALDEHPASLSGIADLVFQSTHSKKRITGSLIHAPSSQIIPFTARIAMSPPEIDACCAQVCN
jgi:hypothetical protein